MANARRFNLLASDAVWELIPDYRERDNVAPRAVARLSDEALEALIDMFMAAEAFGGGGGGGAAAVPDGPSRAAGQAGWR